MSSITGTFHLAAIDTYGWILSLDEVAQRATADKVHDDEQARLQNVADERDDVDVIETGEGNYFLAERFEALLVSERDPHPLDCNGLSPLHAVETVSERSRSEALDKLQYLPIQLQVRWNFVLDLVCVGLDHLHLIVIHS